MVCANHVINAEQLPTFLVNLMQLCHLRLCAHHFIKRMPQSMDFHVKCCDQAFKNMLAQVKLRHAKTIHIVAML